MDILCITHADFETPGVIKDWAQDKGHNFSFCRPYAGDSLPETVSCDFLIVMGGPQSPLKTNEFPYLGDEIAFIQKAIQANALILGFCLGAQLIGEAMGATTERSPEKEVGVYPITLTKEGQGDPILKALPQTFPVIHWHNDMPGLTEESILLAFSEGCPRQAVRYGNNIYGFQCHMEITREGIQDMIKAVPEDLAPSKFTQNDEELMQQDYTSINQTMITILDRLVEKKNNQKAAA